MKALIAGVGVDVAMLWMSFFFTLMVLLLVLLVVSIGFFLLDFDADERHPLLSLTGLSLVVLSALIAMTSSTSEVSDCVSLFDSPGQYYDKIKMSDNFSLHK